MKTAVRRVALQISRGHYGFERGPGQPRGLRSRTLEIRVWGLEIRKFPPAWLGLLVPKRLDRIHLRRQPGWQVSVSLLC